MELLRKILFRITHIGLWATVSCLLISIILSTVCAFTFKMADKPTVLYVITSVFLIFTLANVFLALPDHVYKVKAIIYKNRFATRYVYDYEYRSNIVMQIGFFGNTIYALVNTVLGLMQKSVWFIAIGIFYIIFGFLKFALLVKQSHIIKCENMRERKAISLRVWRFFGLSMFIITIPTTLMVAQVVYNNQNYYIHPIITFGYFIYTSIYLVAAIVKVCQAKMRKNPIFTAYSNMSFCGALMAVLALQTMIITEFKLAENMRIVLNTITGGLVILLFYIISIVVILSTTKQLRRNYPELSTYAKHKEYKESKSIFDRTLNFDSPTYSTKTMLDDGTQEDEGETVYEEV